METLRRFIKIDAERINVDEIVSYGLAIDEDDETYLYVGIKTSDDVFEYYADDVDFELEEKLAELDDLFLINKL